MFTVNLNRIKYGYNGSQKDILKQFNLKFRRACQYELDDEYCIVFLNSIDKRGWKNVLTNNGNTLYEFLIADCGTNKRTKKRITFLKDTLSDYNGYSFIGVFELDENYNWKSDSYPTGKPMEPKFKYNLISNSYAIESSSSL